METRAWFLRPEVAHPHGVTGLKSKVMEQLLKVVDGLQLADVFQLNSSVEDIATAQQVPRWLTMVQDVKPPD
jgi:hypothetical protein